jgi:flagellar motor protein MotB
MSIDPETKREIIIVRRGKHDDHDGHHGGVWKIAYADFMTAMMAFFLVMWLINAANEESKAAVASYFNPVKLMDRHSSPKGVQDIDEQNGKVRFESDKQIENSRSSRKKAACSASHMRSCPNLRMKRAFCRTNPRRAMAAAHRLARRQALTAAMPIAIRSALTTGRARLRKS